MSRTLLPFAILTLTACASESGTATDRPEKDHSTHDDGATDESDPWGEEDEDEDQEPEDDTEDPPEEPQEIPEGDAEIEGAWITVDEFMTEDHCNMEDYVLRGTGQMWILDVVDEGEFELTDGRGVNHCTYDETSFDCDSREMEDHTPSTDYGLSATIVLRTTGYGSFEDTDTLFMQTDIQADCEGSDCWMVELATASFPCEMRLWVAAEAD